MPKIKKKQLNKIIEYQTELSKLSYEVGSLEYKKHTLLSALDKINNDIIEQKKVLEAEYGSVNINLEDGTYVKIEENVEDKKD